MADESRMRSWLEIGTAVLLGLVSVATAAGAYQAAEWSQQSSEYAAAAGQLRDASLASYIASDLAGFDDGERLFDALELEFQIIEGATNVDEIRAQQQVILGAATPGVDDEWTAWVASGYQDALFPTQTVEYAAQVFAPTFGSNHASTVASEIADAVGAKGLQTTVAAVIFAVALLLLGVSGANSSLKVAFALALGGAFTFLVGVVVSIFAVIG